MEIVMCGWCGWWFFLHVRTVQWFFCWRFNYILAPFGKNYSAERARGDEKHLNSAETTMLRNVECVIIHSKWLPIIFKDH